MSPPGPSGASGASGSPGSTGFADYAADRWPRLVRSGVLLGLEQPQAEEAARRSLSRARLAWDGIGHRVGRDAFVYDQLLKASGTLPDAQPSPADLATTDLRTALGVLPVEQRLALVLQRYAGVGDLDARQVLAAEPSRLAARVEQAGLTLAGVASAAALTAGAERAEWIVVDPLDLADVAAVAAGSRRRVRIGVVVALVVIAVLVALILLSGG